MTAVTTRTTRTGSQHEKALTYLAAGALVAAVLAPLRQNRRPDPRDGFPLSYYPMFSARRKRTGTVVHLEAVDTGGRHRPLDYHCAGTGGFNQVRRQIARTVRDGRAQDLADQVAARLTTRPGADDLREVRVVSSRFAYADFFAGRREPEHQRVHATAAVPRGSR